MKTIKRVQTLYSYKSPEGMIPKGVFSIDSPGGIPDVILQDAKKGRNTVVILDMSEDVTTMDKEPIVTTDNAPGSSVDVVEDVVNEEKPDSETPKPTRKRASRKSN